jgi:membrane protease subunit HflC
MIRLLFATLVVLLLVLGRLCVFTVDATEFAYVTVLGQHTATFDGATAEQGAGLHVGLPWPLRVVQRLDRRLQSFDLPAAELLTHDPMGKTVDKTLAVEAYVCWRIPDTAAVERFVPSMANAEQARAILGPRITSRLAAAVGRRRTDDFINTDAGRAPGTTRVDDTLDDIQQELLGDLKQKIREEYGIELVDIRLRRFSHPARVRESIFARIRSERNKKVTEYESEGKLKASNIDSEAEEKARDLLAKARFEEERLKGLADADAMRIRNDAHRQDPEFYGFLKKMEKLQGILTDNKTLLLLSTNRPLFDLLFQPPRPGAMKLEKKEEK